MTSSSEPNPQPDRSPKIPPKSKLVRFDFPPGATVDEIVDGIMKLRKANAAQKPNDNKAEPSPQEKTAKSFLSPEKVKLYTQIAKLPDDVKAQYASRFIEMMGDMPPEEKKKLKRVIKTKQPPKDGN